MYNNGAANKIKLYLKKGGARMNNATLGKTLKAMYKLSGKTLTQLSDETGLTIDTINNLFYARIQKPGLAGVNALVEAMGFSIGPLMAFLAEHPDLPDDADVTELLVFASDTNAPVSAAKEPVKAAKGSLAAEIELINAEHEKQLDHFRATHERYVEQLQKQHDAQIGRMEQARGNTLAEVKSAYQQEIDRLEKENGHARRTGKWLAIAVSIETGFISLLLLLDILNRSIGWFR